jgi:hypothetical protein
MSEVCVTIDWKPDTDDESVIKFTGKYRRLNALEKADMLKDAIHVLQRRYNNVVKNGLV